MGCWVRTVPFPHDSESAGRYSLHPLHTGLGIYLVVLDRTGNRSRDVSFVVRIIENEEQSQKSHDQASHSNAVDSNDSGALNTPCGCIHSSLAGAWRAEAG